MSQKTTAVGFERIIQILSVVYLIAIPFQRVWVLPLVKAKFQLPEIISIPLFLTASLYIFRNRRNLWFSPLDICVVGWLVVNTLVGLHTGLSWRIVIELIGVVYLILLYFAIRLTLSEKFLKKFPDYFTLSAVIAALLGILGWCLSAAGIETRLVDDIDWYPYIGNILGRAMGFTAGANMLAHILMLGIIVKTTDCWSKRKWNNLDLLMIGIMLSGFVLTFSRSVVCLIIAVLLSWHFLTISKAKFHRHFLVWATVLFLSSVNVLGSMFIVVRDGDLEKSKLSSMFLADDQNEIARIGSFYLMPSTKYIRNQANYIIFQDSFPWGVGPGEFRFVSEQLQKEGRLIIKRNRQSEGFVRAMPHNTYLGAMSQLGVLGVIAISALWVVIGYACYQISYLAEYRGLGVGLSSYFISTAIYAITSDIMNFRHLWWLIAITAVLWNHVHHKNNDFLQDSIQ